MAKKTKAARHPMDIFPEEFENADPKTVAKAPAATEAPSLETVLAKLAAIEKANDRLQAANMALMSAPQPAAAQQAFTRTPQPVSMKDLPDIAEDPAKYAEELARRLQAQAALERDHEKELARAAAQENERASGLWNEFLAQHPGWDRDKIQFAAAQVVEKARQRGIDPQRYMTTTKELFLEDVHAKAVEVFGKPKEAEEEDEEEATRTSVVSSGPGAAPRKPSGADEPGDFIKELRELQAKSKFF